QEQDPLALPPELRRAMSRDLVEPDTRRPVLRADVEERIRFERQRSIQPTGVERVAIRDFRGIEQLDIDLPRPGPGAYWTMLPGENGSGKTTILQAVALTLMGDAARAR